MNELALNNLPEEFLEIAKVLQLDAQLLGDYSVKAVNGRHLQAALGNIKKHTDWAPQQISSLSLVQGKDFEILSDLSFPSEGSSKSRQQTTLTYCFPIEVAKTIAMVSKSANGSKVRAYFLHMEKVAQEAYRGNLPMLPTAHEGSSSYEIALEKATRATMLLKAAMGASWGEGYHQLVTHQQFEKVGKVYGVDLVSDLPKPTVMLPGQKQEIDPTQGAHFMTKAVGSIEMTTTQLTDRVLSEGIKGISWNDLMEHCGYITKLLGKKKRGTPRRGLCGVQLTSKADPEWASQTPFGPSSEHPGQLHVVLWHYNALPMSLLEELQVAAKKLSHKD